MRHVLASFLIGHSRSTRSSSLAQKAGQLWLAATCFLLGNFAVYGQAATGAQMTFSGHAVVNFDELAQEEKLHPVMSKPAQAVAMPQMRHPELPLSTQGAMIQLGSKADVAARNSSSQPSAPGTFSVPGFSPPASHGFSALLDNGLFVPPDTQGAVGPSQLVVVESGTFLVEDRTTGAVLQSTSLDTFWSSLGTGMAPGNSRVAYDPYNSRWIIVSEANANTSSSAFLIAVSQTSNPQGAWYEWKVNSDPGFWANFPSLGFNANWIAVGMDLYQLNCSSNCSFQENIYVFNKAQLYSGASDPFVKFTDSSGAYGFVPATTFDNNASTPLYLLQTWNSNQTDGFGYLRMEWITGTGAAPVLNGAPNCSGQYCIQFGTPWGNYGGLNNGGFAPQLGTSTLIDTLDGRMRSLIYRNGNLWGTQTIFMPASAPTHSSIQWFEFDTTGNGFYERIDDTNGVEFRAYPTIAVNKFDDALIGYSTFSASTYASAAYSFESHRDPFLPAEPEQQLIAGLGPYVKFYGTTINKWGFYSNTLVDPINDTDLWTIQEYAYYNAGLTGDFGRWGTWWGELEVAATRFAVSNPSPVTAGAPFSVTVTAQDNASLTLPAYGGTVHFTSADNTAVLPADYTFTAGDNGVHTFTGLVLHKAGTQAVTVTDTASPATGSVNITVNPAAASSLLVTAPASATAGTPFSFNVTAQDPFSNTATGYGGTVHFTSGDTQAVLPADSGLTNGAGTFSATLKTAGNRTMTATDTVTASITGTSGLVLVSAGPAKSFSWNVPPSATVGTAFSPTLKVLDSFGNTATSYTGSVTLSTTGTPTVTLPTPNPYTFTTGGGADNGVHTFANGFNVTAGTSGNTFTITGNDAGNAITAMSSSILVTTDAAITGAGHRIHIFRSNIPVVVASFTDGDVAETGSNFSASINWGDGTAPDSGCTTGTTNCRIVRVGSTNVFNVLGAHTYTKKKAYTVTVTLSDNNGGAGNGSSAVASSTAVFGPLNSSH